MRSSIAIVRIKKEIKKWSIYLETYHKSLKSISLMTRIRMTALDTHQSGDGPSYLLEWRSIFQQVQPMMTK